MHLYGVYLQGVFFRCSGGSAPKIFGGRRDSANVEISKIGYLNMMYKYVATDRRTAAQLANKRPLITSVNPLRT